MNESVGASDARFTTPLTDRQRMVLSSIIRRYVGNAEPVGSRQVSKDIVDALSPATIRNVMADMEEMGLIDQPHTSAGRQPTERGFRIWVDQLMPQDPLSETERQVVDATLGQARSEEQLLVAAALALAEVTRQLGVAISPVLDGSRLDRLELVPVRERTLLLVASFGSGLIRSIAIELEQPVDRERLSDLVRRVHLTALGRTPAEIQRDLAGRAQTREVPDPCEDPAESDLVRQILHALLDLAHPTKGGEAILQGAGNVLSQPELGERKSLTNLVQLMEDRSQLAQLLQERAGHEGTCITIGSENRLEHLRTLSLVTHNYRLGDAKGAVGVLGPTRMSYGKLVAAVDYIALRLSQG
jgi:heat-inducible transcriptional repressor